MDSRVTSIVATLALAAPLAPLAPLARAGFAGLPIHADFHVDAGEDGSYDVDGETLVRPGVEFSSFPGSGDTFDVDVSDAAILITNFSVPDHWDSGNFTGLIFADPDNPLATIDAANVLSTTTMAGLANPGRVYVQGAELYVNWQGLSFDPTTVVDIGVTFADATDPPQPVPAPTAAAAGLGLLLLVLHRRRRVARVDAAGSTIARRSL